MTGSEIARKMALPLAFRQVTDYSVTTHQLGWNNSFNEALLALLLALKPSAKCPRQLSKNGDTALELACSCLRSL